MKALPSAALENALIDLIETELCVMHSFCQVQFPCDVPTTVAMRMSRTVVSSICRLGLLPADEHGEPMSDTGTQALSEAKIKLESLNRLFEARLSLLPANAPEWKIWLS